MIKVSELINHLQKLKRKHGDIQVVFDRFSDLAYIDLEQVDVIEAVPPPPGSGQEWLTRRHRTMPEGMAQKYISFPGN